MKNKIKIKSRPVVEAMVKRFFANTTSDTISLEDAFKNWDRNLEDEAKNKQWLSNKLPHMKYYNLVTPVYAYRNNRRILDRLQLTPEGRRVMNRYGDEVPLAVDETPSATQNDKLTLEEVFKAIARLRKENPEFQITFDVKLKEKNSADIADTG